jgi:hypothetical protein
MRADGRCVDRAEEGEESVVQEQAKGCAERGGGEGEERGPGARAGMELQWLDRGRETAPSEERLPRMLWRQARGRVLALVDLAEVLGLAGHDARPELERALALYERKGNLVMAARTRSRLAGAGRAP